MTARAASPPLRDRLLDAADDCFTRYGVAETTMDDLVRHSGVPRATLYRHTGNKEQIVVALTLRRIEALFSRLAEIVQAHDDLGDALIEAVVFLIDCAEADELIAASLSPMTAPSRLASLVADPGERARLFEQLAVVVDGFVAKYRATGQVREGFEPADAARWLALTIAAMLMVPDAIPSDERPMLLRRMLLPAFLA